MKHIESKYINLDQQKIRRDFPEVFQKYESTHMIKARLGTKIDLTKLKDNESICYGDGKTFHFLLTKVSTS